MTLYASLQGAVVQSSRYFLPHIGKLGRSFRTRSLPDLGPRSLGYLQILSLKVQNVQIRCHNQLDVQSIPISSLS